MVGLDVQLHVYILLWAFSVPLGSQAFPATSPRPSLRLAPSQNQSYIAQNVPLRILVSASSSHSRFFLRGPNLTCLSLPGP